MYLAHIRADGREQRVTDHLAGTAKLCGAFAEAFGERERGELIGGAHDIGKNSAEFQKRLMGGPKVDHATAGAIECARIDEMEAACCIIGHHGGLPDYGNPTDLAGAATCFGRLKKGIQGGIPPYEWTGKLEAGWPKPYFGDNFEHSFWVKMLYSCLVDADFLDTEAFMAPNQRQEYDSMPVLLARLEEKIAPWFPPKTELNIYRCRILRQCLVCGPQPQGLFSLTVPTGGGKTVASLAFAIRHAVEHGMQRIIYVIPYTSIIEQNAQVFRELLGEKNVIEHHSGVCFDEDAELSGRDARRLAAENWDAPVVVTTATQFFDSLYANRPSQCRKLHNIANSVVIFDEAQMIPGCHLLPAVGAIAALVSRFRTTAVLCTATQPVLGDLFHRFSPGLTAREICPDVEENYAQFRRVTYRDMGKGSTAELVDRLCAEEQVLCIVNTRKAAQEIFDLLPEEGRFHLSTLMCPRDRRAVLETVRKRLDRKAVCRVVSTSLIEAGVDVDFPSVYRELAGLDAVMQAAGRCNREGKAPADSSIVTCFQLENPPPLLQRVNIGAAREALEKGGSPGDPETINAYFTAWRSMAGDDLDKSQTVSRLKNGVSGCFLPFRTVAQDFHYIDENTKTVYIPTEEGEALCRVIAEGRGTRQDYRRAGQYAVGIYEAHYQALVSAGDVAVIDEGSGILVNMELYDKEKGLSLQADVGKGLQI